MTATAQLGGGSTLPALVRLAAHPGHRLLLLSRHRQPPPSLLRSHAKAERPDTVVLPQDERVFNPSRETRLILRQAIEVGEHAARLCQLLFAIEGRVGQRKLWNRASTATSACWH